MKIHANGIDIGYEVSGQGPWLVLNHSLGMNRAMWFRQVPLFARSHRVLAWDARGHGETGTTPGPYDFDLLTRDLAGLLDALSIEKAAVLGLSMGGCTAMNFAATYPDRVSALVLSDTTAGYGPGAETMWRERAEGVINDGIESILDVQAGRWFTDSFRETHPEIVEPILDTLKSTDLQGYVATMEGLGLLDLHDRLERINCPTLVVVGGQDESTPPSMAEEIHRGIRNSRLLVLDQAKHLSPVEQAEEFNRAVLDFLREAGA